MVASIPGMIHHRDRPAVVAHNGLIYELGGYFGHANSSIEVNIRNKSLAIADETGINRFLFHVYFS